jgi:hypothetical protein
MFRMGYKYNWDEKKIGSEVLTMVVIKNYFFCALWTGGSLSCCLLHVGFFLGLRINTEDGRGMFLRNTG